MSQAFDFQALKSVVDNPGKYMNPVKDKWFRIIGIPIVGLLVSNLSWNLKDEFHGIPFWKWFGIELIMIFFGWNICRIFLIQIRKKFPKIDDLKKRIVLSLLSYTVIVFLLIYLQFWIVNQLNLFTTTLSVRLAMVNFWCTIPAPYILHMIYEGIYYLEQWGNYERSANQLLLEATKTKLESLKSQVNPHFLFNSLNTLSSLIAEDPQQAENYVDEMSKVYRYLLRPDDGHVVELKTELDFIRSYFKLLEIRHGKSIALEMDITQGAETKKLPPLTLQLLLENAVKHNAISKTNPLVIKMETIGIEQLRVSNKINRKKIKIESSQMGLHNIQSRYQLFNQSEIVVEVVNEHFQVTVPLIN